MASATRPLLIGVLTFMCSCGSTGSGSGGECKEEVAGTVCRPAVAGCDVAEICDGVSDDCPPDEDPSMLALTLSETTIVTVDATATVEWSALGFVGPAEYLVEYSMDETFGSGVMDSGWQTDTSFAVPLPDVATYYARVTARDADLTTCSTMPAVAEITRNGSPAAPTNLAVTLVDSPDPGDPTWTYDLSWDAAVDPEDDDLEYFVEVYGDTTVTTPFDFESATASLVKDSGWISELTWRADDLPSGTSPMPANALGFRVRARDPYSESDWAEYFNWFGSCPFLFVWDGDKFSFESDVFPPGRLGTVFQGEFARPSPEDYYVLTQAPAPFDGSYVMQLTSEREEVEYIDEATLYAAYVPEGRAIYSEKAALGVNSLDGLQALHTTELPLKAPVAVTHVNTGQDVTSIVSSMDRAYLRLNDDPNQPTFQTIEVDLGDLSGAAMIKLIIDGRSLFPTTLEGIAFAATQGSPTKIEVPNAAGDWVELPTQELALPALPAFRRPILLDMTGAFPADDYRVRLTWLYKVFLDAVLFDMSPDEQIDFVELPLLASDVHYRGVSGRTSEELYDLIYEPTYPSSFELFSGAYTKFGDVTPLLTETDDKFVISYGGDELTLYFSPADPPSEGDALEFVLMTHGYYKDRRTSLPQTVRPLPFEAMSNYPYGEGEHYPNDQDHNAYQRNWNTRIAPTE